MKIRRATLLLFFAALFLLMALHSVEAAQQVPQVVLQIGHNGEVKSAAFAPDGKHIATGGSDGTVRLWDTQSGTLLGAWQTHKDDVAYLQFAPQGGLIASAGYDGKVVLRDLAGMVRVTLNAYGPLCFSPDGTTLIAGIPNKKFPGAYAQPALWSTTSGQQKLSFDINNFNAVAFSPDGEVLATMMNHTTIY